jgi:uncharacterized LabA/DUF88 family protein
MRSLRCTGLDSPSTSTRLPITPRLAIRASLRSWWALLQQRFFDFLSHAGYIARRRPVKVIQDQETVERIIKNSLDTEIVLHMLNTVDNYDVASSPSGDSDFERAVDLLRSRGKRLFLVSARGQISRELAYVADKPIVYLKDHRAELARTDRTPGT